MSKLSAETESIKDRSCGRSWQDVMAVALVAGIPLVLLLPCLWPGKAYLSDDLLAIHYPMRAFLQRSMEEGHLPGWNPFVLGGIPFLADPHAAAWYPPDRLLAWLTPDPITQVTASVTLHLSLGAVGAFVFLRRRVRTAGATGGAVLWSIGGFTLAHSVHLGMIGALAWAGWIAWCLDESIGHRRWLIGAGVTGSLALLAGSPQGAFLVGLLLLIGVIARLLRYPAASDLGRTGWLVGVLGATVGCLGLSAVQWIPTAEFALESFRGLPGMMSEQVASWRYLLRIMVPLEAGWRDSYSGPANLIETTFFLGWTPVVVFLAGWSTISPGLRRVVILTTLFGLWLTTGVLHGTELLPPGFRAHERYFALVAGVSSLGLAHAIDRLNRIDGDRREFQRLAVLASGLSLVGIAVVLSFTSQSLDQREVRIGLSCLAALVAALWWASSRPAVRPFLSWLVVLLTTIELLAFGHRLIQATDRSTIEANVEAFRQSVRQEERFVLTGPSAEPWLNIGAVIERTGLRGSHPLTPRRVVMALQLMGSPVDQAPVLSPWPEPPGLQNLFFWRATAILDVGPAGLGTRQLRSPPPAAWLTARCRPAGSLQEAAAAAGGTLPPWDVAIIEADVTCSEYPESSMRGAGWRSCGPDCFVAEAPAGRPGDWLMVPLLPYPGWVAMTAQGTELPVLPANLVFSAVPLDGPAAVQFRFQSASIELGQQVSLASLVILALLLMECLWSRRRRRRRAP